MNPAHHTEDRTTEQPRGSRRPLHERDPGLVDDSGSGTDAAETGTTVVGVTTGDTAVLAADQRASVGGGRLVANKNTRKVEQVHPTAAAALSGTVGHLQQFVRVLRSESRLYADRRGDPPSLTALSTLAGGVLRSSPLAVSPLLGGVDDERGPAVFTLDGGGGVLTDDYAAGGSGMQLAYGVLEQDYEPDLSPSEARRVAARAVESASERDTASGNGLTVATVTRDGVETDDYDAASEVA
ncbi:Ntn hydrolase family protein [Halobacterium jilantaiense]|uniref:Proteasome subunit beta n=1 Tax=Halobacterium jilantaiense TaxID=355548 RepID=A0A1I0PC21_9EURY|nr:proteasome subunit beta [Halobacterium jilantaiense]SEW11904.1 proteasome beta subunit [Halobacterium jilantaiense]